MTILEAIELRHSVRKYTGDPIPENILAVLREKIDEVNGSGNLHVQLVTDEPKSFSGLMAVYFFSSERRPVLTFSMRASEDIVAPDTASTSASRASLTVIPLKASSTFTAIS